ncbi:hypothetical protein M1E08_09645 [Erwinia sp. PK3-005]
MDKSREQFEAWLKSTGHNPPYSVKRGYWEIWKASRAAIEIELPPVMRIEEPAISFCAYGRAGVLNAIYEHGLNVKGDDSGETDLSHQR